MQRRIIIQAILALLGATLVVVALALIAEQVYGRQSAMAPRFDFIEFISNAVTGNSNPSKTFSPTVSIESNVWQTIVKAFTTNKSVQIMSVITTLVLVFAVVFVVYWTTLQQQQQVVTVPDQEDQKPDLDTPNGDDLVTEDDDMSSAILVPFGVVFAVVVVMALTGKLTGWAQERGLFKGLEGEVPFVPPLGFDSKAVIITPPFKFAGDANADAVEAFFANLNRDNSAIIRSGFVPQYYSLTAAPVDPEQITPLEWEDGDPFNLSLYNIGTIIGDGGFGRVYEARKGGTGPVVAIKQIYIRDEKGNEEKRKYMVREAKVTNHFWQLDQQRFVKIHEYYCDTFNNVIIRVFIVMDKLNGVTLRRNMNLDLHTVAVIARELLTAVQLMHSQGWRHRDIKPENVFVTSDGQVKLLDLGLAAPIGEDYPCYSRQFKPPEILFSPVGIESCVPAATVTVKVDDVDVEYALTEKDKLAIMERCWQYEPIDIYTLGQTLLTLHRDRTDTDFREMIGLMRQGEPWKRPTAASLLNHRFITKNTQPGDVVDTSKLV